MNKIFIICSVREAEEDYKCKLESYKAELESKGYQVHLPHIDTNQEAKGIDICRENANAIFNANEVRIFYSPKSTGTHFDMGVAFGFGKRIKVIENVEFGEGKSYPRMLMEWELQQ